MLSSTKKIVKVDIDNLNVRQAPDFNAPVVETCKVGEYEMLDKTDKFAKIGDNKWVALSFVEIKTVKPEKKKDIEKEENEE